MSTRQYITDAATRHQVFLQRYGGGRSKEAQSLLLRLKKEITARLSHEPTEFNRARLSLLLADIESIIANSMQDLSNRVKAEMYNLMLSEANFSAKLFSKSTNFDFSMPSESQLIAAVETTRMAAPSGLAITINETLADFGKKKAQQITNIINDGVLLGDTTPQIAAKVSDMVNNLTVRQAESLVRTATNHISSEARSMVYQANSDVLDGYIYVATLDSRTTLTCASLDQQFFKFGHGPMPPQHWGCRSTTIPKVKSEFDLGKKIKGTRRAQGGDVSHTTSYGGWLKRQPPEFINEALGPERSRLFQSGKLSIDKFVDPTGRVYSLVELERMNPFVFIEGQ